MEGETVWLSVGAKRMRVPLEELERTGGRVAEHPSPRPSPRAAGKVGDAPGSTPEVNVIGRRLDEAIEEVEKALDGALAAGADRFRVVHGHGTGRLREGLRDHLRKHPSVSRLRAADPREGGNGATIVELT
jgi:DNA mismatch repair protein MutS2